MLRLNKLQIQSVVHDPLPPAWMVGSACSEGPQAQGCYLSSAGVNVPFPYHASRPQRAWLDRRVAEWQGQGPSQTLVEKGVIKETVSKWPVPQF